MVEKFGHFYTCTICIHFDRGRNKKCMYIYEADQMLTTGSLFSLDVIMYNRVQLHGVECLNRLTISVKIDSTEKLYFEFSLTSCGRGAIMMMMVMVMMMMLIIKMK